MNILFVIRNNHINNILMLLNGLDNGAQSPTETQHTRARRNNQTENIHDVFHFGIQYMRTHNCG